MQTIIKLIALFAILQITFVTSANGKTKKKNALKAIVASSDSTSAYKKAIKDATIQKGLFTTIWNKKAGKLYLELSPEIFDKPLMLANRVSSTSNTKDYVGGQMLKNILFRFSCDKKNVYMVKMNTAYLIDTDDPMVSAMGRNNADPILKGFKIHCYNSKNIVIDVTSFFCSNERCISPIKEASPASKLLGLPEGLKGTFQADASNISMVKAFTSNVEIKSMLTYSVQGTGAQEPYTVVMHRSLYALPENPMARRHQDDRVGYFHSYKNIYSTNTDRIREKKYIERWRIEPREEDRERYFKGELVEPQQPIVFYVDSAFPEKWRNAIKEGIEIWNIAFEKAGFRNAIKAVDYPADSTGFDPDDMRNTCFRYVATETANAMGPSYVDPRTGEILSADVIWYHNIISLLHNWRFVQTSAVDKRVRCNVFPDELMQESFRYAAAHEVGHTLGLMHNMGASYAFSVDSLRSPSFTQRYGTTPSIMDYARNNYVAQPGDLERGVRLTPPDLGVYDIYAINWGYRLIEGADTPEKEDEQLNKWIEEHAGDPMYEFGAQQILGTIDPTDQTEDLGNDHLRANSLGMENLKITLSNLTSWAEEKGEEYDNIEQMYKEVVRQHDRYIGHVLPYIGGVEFKEIRQGDGNTNARHFISRQKQWKAMRWIIDDLRTSSQWLEPSELIRLFEAPTSTRSKFRQNTVARLLAPSLLFRINEASILEPKDAYNIEDYLSDLCAMLFVSPTAGKLSEVDREIQSAAIAVMIKQTGLNTASAKNGTKSLDSPDDDEHAACSHCLCNMERSFTRFNVGNGTLPQAEIGSAMLNHLNQVKKRYMQYRSTAAGITRSFYDYNILLINRVLNDK